MALWEILQYFLICSSTSACSHSELLWQAFQNVAGHSGSHFCHYPSIFLPVNAQHLWPQYLHRRKPIISGEFWWEGHFQGSKLNNRWVVDVLWHGWEQVIHFDGIQHAPPHFASHTAWQTSWTNSEQVGISTTSRLHCLCVHVWRHYFWNILCIYHWFRSRFNVASEYKDWKSISLKRFHSEEIISGFADIHNSIFQHFCYMCT
jgi:hypothetical protein